MSYGAQRYQARRRPPYTRPPTPEELECAVRRTIGILKRKGGRIRVASYNDGIAQIHSGMHQLRQFGPSRRHKLIVRLAVAQLINQRLAYFDEAEGSIGLVSWK